ncbi:MAG TPA: hypothetical protein VNA30_00560 [Mycobacteriales bacterium]|nr:hypothetical protein [Mycobacteriales bacterium]
MRPSKTLLALFLVAVGGVVVVLALASYAIGGAIGAVIYGSGFAAAGAVGLYRWRRFQAETAAPASEPLAANRSCQCCSRAHGELPGPIEVR